MTWSLSRREFLGTAAALLCSRQAEAADDQGQQVADLIGKLQTKHELAAVLCGVWNGDDEVVTLALGNSMTGVPATKEMHLRTGGVTLTCVCMALLRLADQGRVSLDDKLSRWYPKLPQADAVTLRMLANCSSGYPDYVLSPTLIDGYMKDPFRHWRPEELIDIAMATPLLYKPGTGWNYSHTNFVILGEVLQKVAGKPMGEILDEHIFKPLDLKETAFSITAEMRPPVLHAFSSERGIYEDSTYWSPSWTSHSGLMTSTLHDLGTIARAVGSGSLLSEKSRKEQVAPTTAGLGHNRADLYYGLGIIVMNDWLVQNPRFGGYNLIFAHLPAKRLSIVLATTMGPKNSPDVAYSTILFKELAKLLAPEKPLPEEFK